MQSVFEFDDLTTYLTRLVAEKKDANSRYSIRLLARRLKTSHSNLLLILKGQRSLNAQSLDLLGELVRLSPAERQYARALIDFAKAKTASQKDSLLNTLKYLRHQSQTIIMDQQLERFCSSWYHIALLEMLNLRDFQAKPEWIAHRLAQAISPKQAGEALKRMLVLGLAEKSTDMTIKRTAKSLTSISGVPRLALRQCQKQFMRLGIKAMDTQKLDERFFTTSTMTIDRQKIPEAFALIEDFRSRLIALTQAKDGDSTYQLCVQFFRLTDC